MALTTVKETPATWAREGDEDDGDTDDAAAAVPVEIFLLLLCSLFWRRRFLARLPPPRPIKCKRDDRVVEGRDEDPVVVGCFRSWRWFRKASTTPAALQINTTMAIETTFFLFFIAIMMAHHRANDDDDDNSLSIEKAKSLMADKDLICDFVRPSFKPVERLMTARKR
jgi:hypothetical protein